MWWAVGQGQVAWNEYYQCYVLAHLSSFGEFSPSPDVGHAVSISNVEI